MARVTECNSEGQGGLGGHRRQEGGELVGVTPGGSQIGSESPEAESVLRLGWGHLEWEGPEARQGSPRRRVSWQGPRGAEGGLG